MHLDIHRVIRARCWTAALVFGCMAAGALQSSNAQSSASPPQAPVSTSAQRNVYAAGGQVRPVEAVRGDFAAAGGRVILDQPVGGDAALVGGSVDVRAPVGDDLRAAGGDITIESAVGGELFATGGNVTLARAATVTGGATVYGGNITIDGRVDGRLMANAQRIRINGDIRGDVRLGAGEIELGPLARIGGALRYSSGSELKRAEGATIAGVVTREDASASQRRGGGRGNGAERDGGIGARASWAGTLFFYLSLMASTAVLLLIAPSFAIHTAERIRATPWVAMAVGLGAVLAVPVLAVLLLVTVLGIPLGIMVLSLYPVLLLAGFVVGSLFIARLLPVAMRQPVSDALSRNLGYAALALLLILLLGRLPGVGGALIALLSLAGIGACVLELHGRRKGPSVVPGGPPEGLAPAPAGLPEAPGRA